MKVDSEFNYSLVNCNYCDGQISKLNSKGNVHAKWFYLKLKSCRSCASLRRAETYQIKREEKQKRLAITESEIPIETWSIISDRIYKVGAHGFFYRKNVDNDDWTRADPETEDFCKGVIVE